MPVPRRVQSVFVLLAAPVLLAVGAVPADALGTGWATFTGHVSADGRSGDTTNDSRLGEVGARCDEAFATTTQRGVASTCALRWSWDADDPYSICTASIDHGTATGYYTSTAWPVAVEFPLYAAGAPGEAVMEGYLPLGANVYTVHIDASDFCAATNLVADVVAVKAVPSNFKGTVERVSL